jgi:hypothetical protein
MMPRALTPGEQTDMSGATLSDEREESGNLEQIDFRTRHGLISFQMRTKFVACIARALEDPNKT